MKNVFLFFILVNSFLVLTYAQEPMIGDKKIINYDSVIGNYRLKIPINGMKPDFDYAPYIVQAGNWIDYPAHFLEEENGKIFIEMDEDADLSLWEGRDYWFYGAYLGEDFKEHQTDFEKVWAPEISTDLKWSIEKTFLKAKASFTGVNHFFINPDYTYFSVVDDKHDSILKGIDKLETEFVSNSIVKGMKHLTGIAIPDQFLGVSARFDNQFGRPKLYNYEVSSFRIGGELSLNYRILGPGGIQVFRENNNSVECIVSDLSGVNVKKFILGGYDDWFWLPPEIASNLFILKVEGYKAVTFPKIRTD